MRFSYVPKEKIIEEEKEVKEEKVKEKEVIV